MFFQILDWHSFSTWAIFVIIRQATRINAKFGLSRDDVVSFADIMQSAAVPSGQAQQERAGLLSGGGEEDQGDEQGELIPEQQRLVANVRRGAYDV